MPQGLLYKWVCPKYHFTLFYVGNSSKCDACRKSAELHDKRHREIATFILKIQKIDEDTGAILSPIANRKRKTRKSDAFAEFKGPPALMDIDEESEWADSSTLNDGDAESTISHTPSMKEHFSQRQPTKAERKKARQSSLVRVITPELMRIIDAMLHPGSHSSEDTENRPGDGQSAALAHHQVIKDNISFNTHCFWPTFMRQRVHTKKLLQANGTGKTPPSKNAQEDPEITSIIERLGVPPTSVYGTKERGNLVKQLRNAINDDAEKVDNENRDTMMRMAGYWRYVNRKTYNFMVRNNHIWDWATGQKLEEIEDEDESEADTEDDRETDVTSWGDLSTDGTVPSGAITPLEDYSDDFELDKMKTLRLVDNTASLDSSLNEQLRKEQQQSEQDPTTPKTDQFSFQPLQPKISVQGFKSQDDTLSTSSSFLSPAKADVRYPQPSSIATLNTDLPLIKLSPPANLVFSTPDTNGYSAGSPLAAHDDPNNRYNPLKNLDGSPSRSSQRRARNKTIKLTAAAALPFKETTGPWSTVKGKGAGSGKTAYAAALKKGA
ncbi:MAG: hypothetical protein Q9179_004863 [Wetmoreana sp. 5 TL-2023]